MLIDLRVWTEVYLIFSMLNFHGDEKRHLHLSLEMDVFQAALLSGHPPSPLLLPPPCHQFPSLSGPPQVYSFVATTQLRALSCSLCYKLLCMGVSSRRTSMSLLLSCNPRLPHLDVMPSHFWEVQQVQNAFWSLSAWKHRQVAASVNWPGHELKHYECPSSVLVNTFPGHPIPPHAWAFRDSLGWGQQPRSNPAWGKSREGGELLTLRDGGQALARLCLLLQMQFLDHKMD